MFWIGTGHLGHKKILLFFQKKQKKVFKLFLPGEKIIFLTPSISKVANVARLAENRGYLLVTAKQFDEQIKYCSFLVIWSFIDHLLSKNTFLLTLL